MKYGNALVSGLAHYLARRNDSQHLREHEGKNIDPRLGRTVVPDSLVEYGNVLQVHTLALRSVYYHDAESTYIGIDEDREVCEEAVPEYSISVLIFS